MNRWLVSGFLLIIMLILASHSHSFAGILSPKECPKGKGVVEVKNNDKVLSIKVFVGGDGLKSENHLPKRADGLIFLSSEIFLAPPGKKISTCLPYDTYSLYIEFHRTNIFLIGQWLEKIEEGYIFISPRFTSFSTKERDPLLKDYLHIYGYIISTFLVIFSIILVAGALILRRLKSAKKLKISRPIVGRF